MTSPLDSTNAKSNSSVPIYSNTAYQDVAYVDWDGLVYYDSKVKEYIRQTSLPFGGILKFDQLPDPSYDNINHLYQISEEFVSDNRFRDPGYKYSENTWVRVTSFDDVYLYTIFVEQLSVEGNIASAINRINDQVQYLLENDKTQDEKLSTLSDQLVLTNNEVKNINTLATGAHATAVEAKATADSFESRVWTNEQSIKSLNTFRDNTIADISGIHTSINSINNSIGEITELNGSQTAQLSNHENRLVDVENVLGKIDDADTTHPLYTSTVVDEIKRLEEVKITHAQMKAYVGPYVDGQIDNSLEHVIETLENSEYVVSKNTFNNTVNRLETAISDNKKDLQTHIDTKLSTEYYEQNQDQRDAQNQSNLEALETRLKEKIDTADAALDSRITGVNNNLTSYIDATADTLLANINARASEEAFQLHINGNTREFDNIAKKFDETLSYIDAEISKVEEAHKVDLDKTNNHTDETAEVLRNEIQVAKGELQGEVNRVETNLNVEVTNLANRCTDLTNTIAAESSSRVAEIERVDALIDSLDEAKVEVSEFEDTVSRIRNVIGENSNHSTQQFKQVNDRIDTTEAEVIKNRNTIKDHELANRAAHKDLHKRIDDVITNIGEIVHFRTEIVDNVSDVKEIGILYLIKDTSVNGVDVYKEYLYINDEPVLIGDTSLDLSGYATKTELTDTETALQEAITAVDDKYTSELAKYSLAADVENDIKELDTSIKNVESTLKKDITAVKESAYTDLLKVTDFTGFKEHIIDTYATKDTVASEIANVNSAILEIDSKYANELKNYATNASVNTLEENLQTALAAVADSAKKDLSATKDQVYSDLASKKDLTATKEDIAATYETKADAKSFAEATEETIANLTDTLNNVSERANNNSESIITLLTTKATYQDLNKAITALSNQIDATADAAKNAAVNASNSYTNAVTANFIDKNELEAEVEKQIAEKVTGGEIDLDSFANKAWTKEYVADVTERIRYAVVPVENLICDYKPGEIRLNAEHVTFVDQPNKHPNKVDDNYYIGLKIYAPADAAKFKEDLDTKITDDTFYFFEGNDFAGIDPTGAKYSIIWLSVAYKQNDEWIYWGNNSSTAKYIGYYYTVEWYDNTDHIISSETIRINLTNSGCHNYYVPGETIRYVTNVKDSLTEAINAADTALASSIDAVDAKFANYVTAEELENKQYLTAIPDNYITSDELDAELANYIKDISHLASKEDLSAAKNELNSNIDAVDTKIDTEVANLNKSITTVLDNVNNIGTTVNNIDVKVDEQAKVIANNTNDISTTKTQIIDVQKQLADNMHTTADELKNAIDGVEGRIAQNYITKTDLESKNYVSQDKLTETYATKEFVNDSFSEIEGNYYTKEVTDTKIKEAVASIVIPEGGVSQNYVDDKVATEATRAETAEKALQAQIDLIFNNPDTENVINSLDEFTAYIKEHATIADGFRSDIDDVIGRVSELEQIDHTAFALKSDIPSLDNYAKLSDIPDIDGKADKSEIITTTSGLTNDAKFTTLAEVADVGYITDVSGKLDKTTYDSDKASFALKSELPVVPTNVSEFTNDAGYITAEDIPETDLSNYYNKLETEKLVNEAVNGLEIPEAELYKIDFNTPNFAEALEAYNSGKVLVLINAAPDINSYAVMNYVSDKYITFTKFLMSRSETYGAFNTYYLSVDNTWEVSKEVKLNKVEANVEGEIADELSTVRIGKEIFNIPKTDLSTYYNKTEVDSIIEGIEIPTVPTNIGAFTNDAGYLTEQSLNHLATKDELNAFENHIGYVATDDKSFAEAIDERFATKDDVKDAVKNVQVDLTGYATENYVTEEIGKIDIPDVSNFITAAELQDKADNILFTEDYYVNHAIGGFEKDESIKDMTIRDILIKLLDLKYIKKYSLKFFVDGELYAEQYIEQDALLQFPETDPVKEGYIFDGWKVDDFWLTESMTMPGYDLEAHAAFIEKPADPELPEASGIVGDIMMNETPMYSVTADGELIPISYTLIDGNEEPTTSGFFAYVDESNVVTKAGYQDISIKNDEMYYFIALPKNVDYNSMVEVETWDPYDKQWIESELILTSDADIVNELADEVGIDLSHIPTDKYTIWTSEDICTGSIIRYIIKETL